MPHGLPWLLPMISIPKWQDWYITQIPIQTNAMCQLSLSFLIPSRLREMVFSSTASRLINIPRASRANTTAAVRLAARSLDAALQWHWHDVRESGPDCISEAGLLRLGPQTAACETRGVDGIE